MFPSQLYLTDNEAPLTAKQTEAHQASITALTERIEEFEQKALDMTDRNLLLSRALDYYHIRDFENAYGI